MTVSIPAGQMRINPNTYEQEMWDGTSWIEIAAINMSNNISGSLTTTVVPNGGYTVSTVSSSPITENQKEDIYQFLRENLRVAEMLDDNGKLSHVELQMRAGEGYVWDQIKRVRVKSTDKPY
jgi:hypothetical protein